LSGCWTAYECLPAEFSGFGANCDQFDQLRFFMTTLDTAPLAALLDQLFSDAEAAMPPPGRGAG
jgi:hypothetical protein